MCIRCCVSMRICSLMVANATKPHPIFPRGVWQQLFWLDHNFKIKLPDTNCIDEATDQKKGLKVVSGSLILKL